jgi:DnaJ like chaperone protein
VDPLAWLGLKPKRDEHPRLSAITQEVRRLLPDDEPVVVRYIVIVAVFLTKVAHSDGLLMQCELDHLARLFRHIDRMPPDGIDGLCRVLNDKVPELDEEEEALCLRELKALCDADERLQIMRLLASQATSDGHIVASEHGTLMEIARALDVPETEIEHIEIEAMAADRPPLSQSESPPSRQSNTHDEPK